MLEEAIDPGRVICDPHHHLWQTHETLGPYALADLAADVRDGHNVVSTVYVNAFRRYRATGRIEMRPVGETEWLMSLQPSPQLVTGIVGFADLRTGARIEDVLHAHVTAGLGRFRGIRFSTAWDPSSDIPNSPTNPSPGLLSSQSIEEGLGVLRDMGLTLDIWLYFTQLDDVAKCADKFPDLQMVVNHFGGPLGIGPYSGRQDEVWEKLYLGLKEAAKRENVFLKLGGIGFPMLGKPWGPISASPSSVQVAKAWRPLVRWCIETFGPDRCMFESNFPVDRVSLSYRTLWNAFKLMTEDLSEGEKLAVMHDTAAAFYRLQPMTPDHKVDPQAA